MLLNDSSKKPATNRSASASGYDAREREAERATLPSSMASSTSAAARLVRKRPRPLSSRMPASERAGRVGAEQRRVRGAGIAVPEVAARSRASAPGSCCRRRTTRAPASTIIAPSTGIAAHVANGVDDVGEAAHGARGGGAIAAELPPVRRAHEPQHQRQVERGVEEHAARRPEREHDQAADAGPDQHAEVARGGVRGARRSAATSDRRCRRAASGST